MAEGITLKRIIDMDEAAELTSSDYALVDSATGGPKKFALGNELSSLKEDLKETESSITSKMVRVASKNLLKSDSDYTQGYMPQNGVPQSATTLGYTRKFPVSEGDIVRYYNGVGSGFAQQGMRYVCAYDANGDAVSASGAESATSYTVPNGVAFVVITFYFSATNKMVTINYEPIAYEPYFAPYYVASDDFVADVLANYEIPKETVKGYNLLHENTGTGYYYGQTIGARPAYSSSASYHYSIIRVKPNTRYYVSSTPRFWALTDDNDIVLNFGERSGAMTAGYIDSGNATKLYYSIENAFWNLENTYGSKYAIIVSEENQGTFSDVKKPSFINGISQNMMDAKYGCALPKDRIYFTNGNTQHWYKENYIGLKQNIVECGMGASVTNDENGLVIPSMSPGSSEWYYRVFDSGLSLISQQSYTPFTVKADNVQDCSALVIGDSTVAHNYMTQKMLDAFAERDKTLTLLGTRGTAPNNHEGRAGWSAMQYCTVASVGGVANPFYNPSTENFDFSYYMTNQGYSAVDFVVVQLGINDLYCIDVVDAESKIKATTDYVSIIIDSILAFNPSQKILLNLPTALNSDRTKHHYRVLELLRNVFIRYNDYIQLQVLAYSQSKVRCSYCHLILDPNTDISDDVHPTVSGYEKMANEVVSQINCWQN